MGLLDYFDQFTVDQGNAPTAKSRSGQGIIDRNLYDRSYLDFKFPRKEEGGPDFNVRLPFVENVKITERKRAKYQKYSPLGRSSELYTYLGSESRKLNLQFNLSMKHIEAEGPPLEGYLAAITEEETYTQIRNKFKGEVTEPPPSQTGKIATKYLEEVFDIAHTVYQNWLAYLSVEESTYLAARYGIADLDAPYPDSWPTDALPSENNQSSILAIDDDYTAAAQSEILDAKIRIVDLVIYWINIIRTSVVNNAMDPTLGPPIIRLNHGIMYQDVPCICTQYSFSIPDASPMDIDTLLPHQISVTMQLEEIRTGNFGEFRGIGKDNNATMIQRDNLAGWEAVIVQGTMDPGTL